MPPCRIVCYIVRAMNATTLTRRTLLGTSAAAAVVPLRGHAETLQHLDLLIDWKPAPTYAGFYVAREIEAFKRRGLDVRIVEGHGANVAAEMIAAGKEYWIGSSSASATAIGRSRDLAIRSLAVYYRRTPTVLYSRTEDRIDAPRDLLGKRVGLAREVAGDVDLLALHGQLDLQPELLAGRECPRRCHVGLGDDEISASEQRSAPRPPPRRSCGRSSLAAWTRPPPSRRSHLPGAGSRRRQPADGPGAGSPRRRATVRRRRAGPRPC